MGPGPAASGGLGASGALRRYSLFTSALLHLPPAACEGERQRRARRSLRNKRGIVLRQSPPFQGHIIAALDTARAILVGAEQTGISSARINHFTGWG